MYNAFDRRFITSNQIVWYTKFILKSSKVFKNVIVTAQRFHVFDINRASWCDYSQGTLFANVIMKIYQSHIIKKVRWKKIQCNPNSNTLLQVSQKSYFLPLSNVMLT